MEGLAKNNYGRPRALINLWLICHGKQPTKDRLSKFGMIQDTICSPCNTEPETMNHLFFNCSITHGIWTHILNCIEVIHDPNKWHTKIRWAIKYTNRKGWRAKLLKLALIKVTYGIWQLKNEKVFDKHSHYNIIDRIIESIIYIGWNSNSIRQYIGL